jgi:hypothetical protein
LGDLLIGDVGTDIARGVDQPPDEIISRLSLKNEPVGTATVHRA